MYENAKAKTVNLSKPVSYTSIYNPPDPSFYCNINTLSSVSGVMALYFVFINIVVCFGDAHEFSPLANV